MRFSACSLAKKQINAKMTAVRSRLFLQQRLLAHTKKTRIAVGYARGGGGDDAAKRDCNRLVLTLEI